LARLALIKTIARIVSLKCTCTVTCVMAVQGHPKSFILAPIKSAYATSCYRSAQC